MSSNGLFMTVYHYAYKCDDDSQGRGLYYKTFLRSELILYRNKLECLSLSVTFTLV